MTLRDRVIGAVGLRSRRDWILIVCAFAGAVYLATSFVPQAILYITMKSGASGAAYELRAARWDDGSIACGEGEQVGPQLDRLFENGFSSFLARVHWFLLPPRFELYVTGVGRPALGTTPRHILLTIGVGSNGRAELLDATLAGERDQLESAKLWLVAACTKPLHR